MTKDLDAPREGSDFIEFINVTKFESERVNSSNRVCGRHCETRDHRCEV